MVTLFIADDEILVRNGIKFALSELDLNLSIIGEAGNGVNALEQMKQEKADILITDIKMPLMDGLELIRQLMKTENPPQIIIISSYADFDFAKQAMKLGVLYYVLKPIKASELKEALESCIAKLSVTAPPDDGGSAGELIAYIKMNYNRNINLEDLATKFNFSTKYITRLFKKHVGKGFIDYVTDLRIEMASALLVKTEMRIKEIASYVGYEDSQYFHRVFKTKTGKTPVQYRQELKR